MQKKTNSLTESYTLNFEHPTTKDNQETTFKGEEYTIKEEESRKTSLKIWM